MAVAPDADSEQGWVVATFDSAYPAGTVVQIASGDEVIATWTADKNFSSVVFSSDAITSGESYTVLRRRQGQRDRRRWDDPPGLHVRGHQAARR